MSFENDIGPDVECALRSETGTSYRRTKTGKYEAFCSDHCRYVYLGTHRTVCEAEEAIFNYRKCRLIDRVGEYGLDILDGVVFKQRYIAFPNGLIFNLHGEQIRGGLNRDGYVNGIIDGKNVQFHRIIASIFCERELGKDFVNHINGDKQNNAAYNLEWVTRSENAKHAFDAGLQRTVAGSPVYSASEKQYMRDHCFDNIRTVASHLGRNPETVRKYMAKYRREYYND